MRRRFALSSRHLWPRGDHALRPGAAVPTPEQVEKLAQLRIAYDELAEVYDAMRRMVERGYLTYPAA